MFQDVILMGSLVLVLFIIWVGLMVNLYVRKARARQIKKLPLAGYVTFLNNFKEAEAAQERGNIELALAHFRRALQSLETEEKPDELVEETKAEVRERIAALEGSE